MFTGIVETTGEVLASEADTDGRRLRVGADLEGLERGESIAVSGACLTVEEHGKGWFEVFLSAETVERTYLGGLRAGDPLNVERALPADGRFDGHFVQGHVDATAAVAAVERVTDTSGGDGGWEFRFSIPEGIERYLVAKGSVAVDGISLTVADLADGEFGVAVIPATYEITTLSSKAVGDPVHIEVDVVAKYVERLLAAEGGGQSAYADR